MGLGVLAISVIFLQLWTVEGSNPEPMASPAHGHFGSSVALSPAAVRFFGPSAENDHFSQSALGEKEAAGEPPKPEKSVRHSSSKGLSEGAIAGIMFGVLFGVFFVAGASYVYVTRKSKYQEIHLDKIRTVMY